MSLPIDAVFSDLNQYLQTESRVILQAAPGAGKSTRLPLLLLEQGQNQLGQYSPQNQILILEPRRVAARQIASYLATQLGEKVGQSVGLAMRGENKTSAQTVITVITDGVLVKMLQSDPELAGVGLVIFDEFHERALQSDLALALTLDSQELNESLGVLVMSATIDTISLAAQLQAKIVCAEGRQFPVDISYVKGELVPTTPDIINAVKVALSNHDASVLVFLSGLAEIKAVMQGLQTYLAQEGLSETINVMPLYGGLSLKEQVSAIQPAPKGHRKVVLATNIAQTSLTIDGIDVVVDAGQEKVVHYQPRFNTEVLVTQATSKAAAEQRAGRAGRLRPGFCYRIGSAEHWQRRAAYDVAEIERVDLSQLLLEIQAWGANIHELFWPSEPEPGLIKAATTKLIALGFWQINDKGKLQNTRLVEAFRNYGADLRVSRLLDFAIELANRSQSQASAIISIAGLIAAYLSDNSAKMPANILDLSGSRANIAGSTRTLYKRFIKVLTDNLQSSNIPSTNKQVKNAQPSDLTKTVDVGDLEQAFAQLASNEQAHDFVAVLLAAAFPDRIAKQTKKRWKMSSGGAVEFHPNSQAYHSTTNSPDGQRRNSSHDLLVVVDFNASQYGHYVQSYVPVSLDVLEEYLPSLIKESKQVLWSESKQGPSAVMETRIGELVLSQTNIPLELTSDEWAGFWSKYVAEQLKTHGLSFFGPQQDKIQGLIKRVELVHKHQLSDDFPVVSASALIQQVNEWLLPYLTDVKSKKQLLKLNFVELLESWIGWQHSQTLKQWCPLVYQNPAGKKVKIDYSGQAPKISVRLQEMFGEPQSPTICLGKQAILIELLSPAQRPLQLTQDLANFWQNAYVEVKKEMKGRYPKHRWPDDPANELPGASLKKHQPKPST